MELPSLVKDNVKIEWVDLGEGWDGDYNENDPNDQELLRFDVYSRKRKNGAWEAVDDASYCTQVPLKTPRPVLNKLLQHLMDNIEPAITGGWSVKKLCERLSWISPEWVKK
jgi:hypothetical protein